MKGRILLADDDPSVLKMTKARLEHTGYEVVVARDGEEVLEQVAVDGAIDLILLDLKMPKLDGVQVCQRLKANPSTAKIPVMIFSASETFLEKLADLCLEAGASDWIKKPFHSQELLEKIHKLLGEAGTSQQGKETGRMRVLVVDDDPATLEFFEKALPTGDFEVVAVGSGEEAVAAVKASSFFLAFVDIIMPGMDGLAVLKALLTEQPALRVVMMTGYAAVEDMVTLALQFGAVDSLHKPFKHASDVLKTIEQFRK